MISLSLFLSPSLSLCLSVCRMSCAKISHLKCPRWFVTSFVEKDQMGDPPSPTRTPAPKENQNNLPTTSMSSVVSKTTSPRKVSPAATCPSWLSTKISKVFNFPILEHLPYSCTDPCTVLINDIADNLVSFSHQLSGLHSAEWDVNAGARSHD